MKIHSIWKSFGFAFNGLKIAFAERNFKIHLIAAIIVILAGFILKITNQEFLILIFAIISVLTAETFNTAIEKICDIVRDNLKLDYEATKIPRDLAAGAVILTVICSIIVGIIIFLPKIIR